MVRPAVNIQKITRKKVLCFILPAAALFSILLVCRSLFFDVLSLVFGSTAASFLIAPLSDLYEKRLSRPIAALLAMLSVAAVFVCILILLMPVLIQEVIELFHTLPETFAMIQSWLASASGWIERHIPGIRLPAPDLNMPALPEIASGTIHIAGNIADRIYRISLTIVLGYFFLCDRTRLMIRLELLIPQSMRKTAVCMGKAVCRELKLYLRGQCMISLAVGSLAAAGLYLAGVRSSLVLGLLVGILNIIPYFGPVLGGIPAVLMALNSGWTTALAAAAVLWIIQQLDGTLISPRILGSVTGLSPAAVLLAIYIGSGCAGIPGMLFALPVLMAFRTVFRVFVQRHENV